MNIILYLATSIGLYIVAQANGSWDIIRHSLQDHSLTSVAASNEYIIVGTPDGLWRSSDNGSTWQKVGERALATHIRWLASSKAQPQTVYAGTEPAGILISHDGGLNWVNSDDVEKLRDAMEWFLPYSPEAGCVRGFAIAESKNRNGVDHIYAAVEVGGVLVSSNGGKTWRLYSEGMKSPWGRHMVERFLDKGDNLYAILSNGEIWLKQSNQPKWSRILTDIGHVNAVAAL